MKRLAAGLLVLSFFLVGFVGCENKPGDEKTTGGTAASSGTSTPAPASTDKK